jgi:hypothetical protein
MCKVRSVKQNRQTKPATGNQFREIWETYQQEDEYQFDCLVERESGIEAASFQAWQAMERE